MSEKFTKMKINLKHKENMVTDQIEIFLLKEKDIESIKKINFNCIDLFTVNSLPENELYFFIVLINSSFDILKNEFQIEFLYSNENVKLEFLQNIEPYKITDKGKFEKNGNIFREIMIVRYNLFFSLFKFFFLYLI
jgi:hypothetical protein